MQARKRYLSFAAFAAIALALASASCVSVNASSSQTTARVFKTAGSVQCAEGGSDLATFARQLEEAGFKVISSACGSDGRMRAAGRCFRLTSAKAQ